ncbi:Fic family protein [Oceanivirga salmonicida]|uniref:Fic family protein n=1 Tax=Oceanivirga salmonicida TaxID=1769291 RepID=UPI001E5C2907|nr:Fic family protein [Oceanivirga salmonicida]
MIFEGLSVEGMKLNDINTIVNLKNAWYFVIDKVEYAPMDFKYISQVHREIANYNLILNPGEIRTFPVSMGGTNWKPNMPNKDEIDENLDIINKIENATDKALTMMLYLMRTQIFSDGNKRVATLIANQILI